MPKRHIRRLEGELSPQNFDRVANVILEDEIVALDLLLDQELFEDGEEGTPSAYLDGSRITLSKSTLEHGGVEININEAFSPQWGSYRVDGIFSVKSGGMFQGVVCVGLIPTDEALVKLNQDIKFINIQL